MRRPWLLPLVPLWAAGVWVQDILLRVGVRRVRWLQGPVISVGSLSAGGAGKTPVVIALAKLLTEGGFAVDVLSRGYGRRRSGLVEEVDATGDSRQFGDEPLEMARAGLRVFVGANRFAAGRVAEQEAPEFPSQKRDGGYPVHLLDDGFQHRRLARDVDVVLVTAQDLRDGLLPAGTLRERRQALRRADILVVREDERAAVLPWLHGLGDQPVWVVRRELVLPPETPQRPFIFSGIARPDGFAAMLRETGVQAVGSYAFRDHHAYRDRDFDFLADAAAKAGAGGFVTTAKDAVKLTGSGRERLEQVGPVAVAALQVTLQATLGEAGNVLDQLRQRILPGSSR